MRAIAEKVQQIEAEMRRIGFWSSDPARTADEEELYAGLPFEQWLQFVFLPSVKTASATGNFSRVPPNRVGLAALRQYDYHSVDEKAFPLVELCHELERLLSSELSR